MGVLLLLVFFNISINAPLKVMCRSKGRGWQTRMVVTHVGEYTATAFYFSPMEKCDVRCV